MEELRENRERYKTASPSERKLLDQQFDQTLLSTQKAFNIIAAEIEKMPKKKPAGPRGIVQIDNPERTREEQMARVNAAQLGVYEAHRTKEDAPVQPAPDDPGTSTRQSDAGSFSTGGTAQLKGALDVYVHVEGTPTKVSVLERPGGNLELRPELGLNNRFLYTGY